MGIAGSRRLLKQAGWKRWAKTGWSVSGVARGSRFRRSRSHEDGCGSTMVRACGSGRHIATMCGATTSSARGRMMAAAYGSSTSSMNTRAKACWCVRNADGHRHGSSAFTGRRDGDEGEYRNIFARTMGRSSSPKTYGTGWPTQEQRRCTSSLALRGRTATARASTLSSGMSF